MLFDGAGLARYGLEKAGHDCTGFELDPSKHALSLHLGSGNSVLADVRDVDLSGFDAVWASPPCQLRSRANGSPSEGEYKEDLLDWCLALPHEVLWVENVVASRGEDNAWGTRYNAAQFTPLQNRNRIIGGRYIPPRVNRPYKPRYPNICPAIMASEWSGTASDNRKASRFYGRRLTIQECAYHQGLYSIPEQWFDVPEGFTPRQWEINLYEAIGNGVPVYMAKAFGDRYK